MFNVEPYIGRCVRSLFGQTIQDIEYIFIDDCTPDRSMGVMQEVLADFPNRKEQVRCYRMPQNSGQAKVRMQGISMATGKYVIHCDPDDDVPLDAYRKMYEKAITDNLDIVVCDFYMVKNGRGIVKPQFAKPGDEIRSIFFGRTMGSLCCRLIKRSVLNGIQAPIGNMIEDTVITVQAICNSRFIGYLQEPLYYYFLRDDSITMTVGLQANLKRWEESYVNTRLLVDLLEHKYGYSKNGSLIVYYKYRSRYYLNSYVHISKYYRMWKETFPEINKLFLHTSGIPLEEKFWFFLIRIHLYYPWKRITYLFRRVKHG